ncbi:MAG: GlcG/HbpS family heme-binding protein [Candidatus Limnocylindrales bacterium]
MESRERHQPELIDVTRGPTASQTAGLTLAAARAIIEAVKSEARALGVPVTCAVVDSGDQFVAFERMDSADLVGITLARDKAFTALVKRMPTRDLALVSQPGTLESTRHCRRTR